MRFLKVFVFALVVLFSGCTYLRKDDTGFVDDNVLLLLKELNINHDGTLKNIVDVTQKVWLRRAGHERWNVVDKYEEKREKLLILLKNIGMIDKVIPKRSYYTYAILLGSTVFSFRKRLSHLIKLFKEGVRFSEIVVLVGQRGLSDEINEKEATMKPNEELLPLNKDWTFEGKMPKTEFDMAKMVFSQTDLPGNMKKVKITFIDTPKQKNKDGSLRRPNTEDTIIKWLATSPKEGICLAISGQPHILYQSSVLRTHIPHEFGLEVVGVGAKEPHNIAVILDALARYLYQENKVSSISI